MSADFSMGNSGQLYSPSFRRRPESRSSNYSRSGRNLKAHKFGPFDFETQVLGVQIKKKHLELGLSRKRVGMMLGVTSFTVLNWK